MKTLPYELGSIRSKRFWQEIADKLELHVTIIKEARINKYWQTDSRDFGNLIKRGEITREQIMEAASDFLEMPDIELNRRQMESEKCGIENDDDMDLLNYRLKQIIEVGDYIVSNETKTFCFSGKQYQTKGKKYRITELNDYRENLVGFTAITTADIKKERIWWSNHGTKSLWRGNQEIWNWHLAYLELFKENNPNHPQTQEMIEHCTKQAELTAKGEDNQDNSLLIFTVDKRGKF